MANVDAFTLGPMAFQQGSGLSGPRRPPIQFLGVQSWWANVKARFHMWNMRRKGLAGLVPYGPRAWAGGRVVPMAAAREAMLMTMSQQNVPADFHAVNANLITRRYQR